MSLKQTVQQVHKIPGEVGVDHALIGDGPSGLVDVLFARRALDWTELKSHADLFGQWNELERLRTLSERKS